jgi:predicted ATPase/DNA-binding winged helix-turn-helix (wHTH) protein
MEQSEVSEDALAFGPFKLFLRQKQLLEGNKPVRLGSRAFDLLAALVERSGEVVSRAELEACVWPTSVVEETSVRVHISALRKALGDGHGGTRFITNVPGRGYCFVAPVSRPRSSGSGVVQLRADSHNLPVRLTRMIGREDAAVALRSMLAKHRFVTLAGPGGIGKTTLALAVAEDLLGTYRHGIRFVDVAPLVDSHVLPGAVAAALDVSLAAGDPLAALGAFLRERELLIVLDNCEHLVDAAARLAESLLRSSNGISVLVTSREPLNAEGEWVYRLEPLNTPAEAAALTADAALAFPAIELFVQRAIGNSDTFELSDAMAPALAGLCRRLDGIPLAIELAAARVDALGINGLAEGLKDSLALLTKGRRTASPRHRTLTATIDWSYRLLPAPEQRLLRQLSAFRSAFTMEAACVLAADAGMTATDVAEGVMNLAAKSLLSTDAGADVIRYRLLDTTRSHAFDLLLQSGEANEVFRRHAAHFRDQLIRAEADWETMSRARWMQTYCQCIDDIRAALDWGFSPDGDLALAVSLTAAAMLPVVDLGLLDQYHDRIEKALKHAHLLDPPQPVLELRLNTALCMRSGASTRSNGDQRALFARTLDLAESIGAPRYQIGALYSTWIGAFGTGDYKGAMGTAEHIGGLARALQDPPAILLADRLTAQTRHFLGDQAAAKRLAERVLRHPDIRMPPDLMSVVPRRVSMRIILARTLWLEGAPDSAKRVASECVELAAEAHPTALKQAIGVAACPIAFWRGDLGAVAELVERLRDLAMRHGSDYWASWAHSYAAVLNVRRLADSVGSDPHRIAPAALGPSTRNAKELDCIATLDGAWVRPETVERAEQGIAGWCAAEVLRAHGEQLLVRQEPGSDAGAEARFGQALELARRQDALSWELRAASSLARLWRRTGRDLQGRELVAGVLERFSEGFETADLRAARAFVGS